jgi:hypothetical protein
MVTMAPTVVCTIPVVSMYDLTGSLLLALGDPQSREHFIECNFFIGAICFGANFLMSRYNQRLEHRLEDGTR